MKTGDKVKIYQDPFTRKDFEGEATVLQVIHESHCDYDLYVEFPEDPNTAFRRIVVKTLLLLILLSAGIARAEWIVETVEITAYCSCEKCCGDWADGVTASMHKLKPGDKVVAAPKRFAFNTPMYVPGYGFTSVQDRGGAIKGNRLDLWFPSHKEALIWGRQKNVTVVWWKD